MMELIRDTAFGQLVRLVTRNKVFQFPEERDPAFGDKYINLHKSRSMVEHGTTKPPVEQQTQQKPDPSNAQASEESIERRTTQPTEQSSAPLEKETEGASPVGSLSTLADEDLARQPTAPDPEKGRDVDIVDWWGPEDPENPRNWSTGKKFFVTFEICFLTFSVYIGSAIYTAGVLGVAEEFGVSRVAATLGLTLFVLGYATGPMLWSPMSEIPQVGRNPVYIITLALFVVLQVPTALATNFGMLMAFRFITGFVGSPSLATGGASIGDMYSPSKRAYGIAVWGIGAVCGPTLGPLVGGFAAENEGWAWTIWELMWLSGFCLVLLFFFLPETSSANILYRRTMRLRRVTGNTKLMCEPQLVAETMTGNEIVKMILVRPFTMSFTEPMLFLLNFYIALIYGLLYLWFESFPIVFIGIYGFSLGTQGLAFIGIFVGVLVVIPPFFWYMNKYTEPKFNAKGELKPEYRLPPAFVGAFCIPICMFWFGWSSKESIHWIVPIIGTAWFSVGAFLLFNAVLNYLGDAYPTYAASVYAGNDLMRSSFGAAFPLFATAMYDKLGVGWASSLLGFLSIAFIPIPFFLYKYGERLRMRSKYALKEF